ncbi:MAG TPA: hypothetical protein VED59_02765, partial [Acidimicrobiales bacterium]|nr:hypothetical protein [Acidimicrobiales bacterium]
GLRMVADAGTGLHWLSWVSPLGWVEQLQPLTDPRPWALLPIGGFTAVLVVLAVRLAGRRDLGASTWRDQTERNPRPRLLSGSTGLTLRLRRWSVAWWTVAIATSGLLMGIIAKAAGTTIVGSSVQQVFSRLGVLGSGTSTFLGITLLTLAVVIGFQGVAELGGTRDEEAEGRLDHLLTSPVSRSRWLSGRLLVAIAALLLSGIAAGVFTWIGAAAEGSGLGISSMLSAGINSVPPAIFVLGVGALVFGRWPLRASAAAYAVLGWSALIELVGGFFAENHWVLDTSLFHQMTSAPAVVPNWQVNGVVAGLGLAAMAVGAYAFRRRDLQTE